MHRVLLFAGHPYEIYSYGFCLVVAMGLGLKMALRRAPRYGMTSDQVFDFVLALLVGGMVGGRVLSVICDWPLYAHASFWQLLNIRAGGLAGHGALLGGLIGFITYRVRSGVPAVSCSIWRCPAFSSVTWSVASAAS